MDYRTVMRYLKGSRQGNLDQNYLSVPVTTAYNICVHSFPRCCGVAVVTSFIGGKLGLVGRKKLQDKLNEIKAALAKEETSILVATTAKDQSGAAMALKKVGFKEVHTQHNPKSGGAFTMWSCVLLKKNARKFNDPEPEETDGGFDW